MKYQLFQVKHSTGVSTLVGEADNINDLVSWADKVAYTDNYTWDDVYKLYPHSKKHQAMALLIEMYSDRNYDAIICTSKGTYTYRYTRPEKMKFQDAITKEVVFVE